MERCGVSFLEKKAEPTDGRSRSTPLLGIREPGEPLFPQVIVRFRGGFGCLGPELFHEIGKCFIPEWDLARMRYTEDTWGGVYLIHRGMAIGGGC